MRSQIGTGPDEVLLRLNVTGLCYSDIHYMMGDLGIGTMSARGVRSPGHEGAGVVVKVGSNVKNFKVGDRGGVKPTWTTCGACEMCWSGFETHCGKRLMSGLDIVGTHACILPSKSKQTRPKSECFLQARISSISLVRRGTRPPSRTVCRTKLPL